MVAMDRLVVGDLLLGQSAIGIKEVYSRISDFHIL